MGANAQTTKVIFRVWTRKDFRGELIAFFPEIIGRVNDLGSMLAYSHVGQHWDADYYDLLSVTRPARETEYAALKKELESIGYVLDIRTRDTEYKTRLQQMH